MTRIQKYAVQVAMTHLPCHQKMFHITGSFDHHFLPGIPTVFHRFRAARRIRGLYSGCPHGRRNTFVYCAICASLFQTYFVCTRGLRFMQTWAWRQLQFAAAAAHACAELMPQAAAGTHPKSKSIHIAGILAVSRGMRAKNKNRGINCFTGVHTATNVSSTSRLEPKSTPN